MDPATSGVLDVVFASLSAEGGYRFMADGSGGYTSSIIPDNADSRVVALGDYDGDG